jgi:zinc transporter ZupT
MKAERDESPPKTRGPINYRLCSSILLGDWCHNFADGIFIGAGFKLCTTDVAISIMLATLYHEIAQELADFFLLTEHANLSVPRALLLNFISGLSCTLGGILILAFSLTNEAVGIILGVAGGVYIYVAASECVPRIELAVRSTKDRLISLGWFCVGAIPIGLVLLNHQHCD